MELDARSLSDQAILDTDVCIVGAGPAGLCLAAELADGPARVLLLESGRRGPDANLQDLNEGAVEGDAYGGLASSRHRQVGGTARLWNTPLAPDRGAKYVPLDPSDFRGEQDRPPWPFGRADLDVFYEKAHARLGLGPFRHEARDWNLPPSPIPSDHPVLASRVYHFGFATPVCREMPDRIAASGQATLCHGITVTGFNWQGSRISSVDAATPEGRRLQIHAGRVVLAAGGVENARLLLVEAAAGRWHDESGWLGRGFMEHPRDYTLTLGREVPSRKLEFFDVGRDGTATVGGRMALREEAILRKGLPNASVTLLPRGLRLRPFHWRLEDWAWRRLGWNLQWPPGYGWSRLPRQARLFDGFQLLVNLEEYPHRDNRLVLDEAARDRFGVPRVKLLRRWHADDAARLERLRRVLARSLRELGLGPVHVAAAAIPNPDSHHHLGTTRMGTTPDEAVTDHYGQVFGTDNLFVVGGSLFPAAGFANPTLTSVALALRLAARLREAAA